MLTVVPAILEKTLPDIRAKVERIRPYAPFVQLDVMDGEFVPNITFRDPSLLADLPITMEAHLMIAHPELQVRSWALPNISRLIVHVEAVQNMEVMMQELRATGKEIGIALNPGTSTYTLHDIIHDIDMVVVMGVEPGFSGQKFIKDVLEKIKELKRMRPKLLVEVDGGVSEQTAPMIVQAGCDILAAASFLWNSVDLGAALEHLRHLDDSSFRS